MPRFEIDAGNRLTGFDIDELDVERQGHARLFLRNVLADEFAGDLVQALRHFGREDAALVA
jgi:hypothetical protein